MFTACCCCAAALLPLPLLSAVLQRNCTLLDKYAETRDVRLISRVFRYTNFLRQFLPISELLTAVDSHISDAGKRTQLAELAKKVDESKRKTVSGGSAQGLREVHSTVTWVAQSWACRGSSQHVLYLDHMFPSFSPSTCSTLPLLQ